MNHRRTVLALLLFALAGLVPAQLEAKGGGIGFWMEGTVTDLKAVGRQIQFTFKGRFWFDQYSDQNPPLFAPQKIEVDCTRGISVAVHQNKPFYAFTPDWRGGALREDGALLRILQAATGHNRKIKFELLEPKIAFDSEQTVMLTDAAVIRATDADLH